MAEVEDERVDDLVEPVEEPERDAREDDVPAAPLDLDAVGIEDEREQRDRVPLELIGIAQEALGIPREIGNRGHAR